MFEEETKKYAIFLEKNNFTSIKSYLENLKTTENFSYNLFWALVYNNNILYKILEHKVSLAILISRHLNVNVSPEDRSRLIYLVAQTINLDHESAEQMAKKEFGPDIRLPETIISNNKSYSWKLISIKAREIKTGIYNNCYLQVLDLVKVLHKYFTFFKETDPKKIEIVNKLSIEIITLLNSSPIVGMPYSKERKDLVLKIQQFYKLTNRINLDIKKIEEDPDFTAILDYTIAIHMACDIKIDLISKRMSPLDSEYALKSLLKHFGETKFNDLLSTEELARFGKHLEPIKNQITTKQ